MRLYKRDGFWWCSFPWSGKTVRRSTRCTTRGAALLVAQRWERERADPDHAAAAAATVGSAVDGYLDALERTDAPESTKTFYRQKCGVLLRHFGADSPLNETITAGRVDRFLTEREREPVAWDKDGQPTRYVTANTLHKELVALRQVLRRARRRGEFRRALDEVMPVGFSPRYVPRTTSLTLDQAQAIILVLARHRAAVVAFFLATAARLSEAFSQRAADVNLATGEVRLRGTKTAGSDRAVIVPPFARELLVYAVAFGGGKGGLLLRPWPSMRRDLARACAAAGAPPVTANDLRRSLATWLSEGGVADEAISRVLGHRDTTMVRRVYGQPSADAVGELVARQAVDVQTVRLVYASLSVADGSKQALSASEAEKLRETVGRAGLEPATYGLKGQAADTVVDSENAAGAEHPQEAGTPDVRVTSGSAFFRAHDPLNAGRRLPEGAGNSSPAARAFRALAWTHFTRRAA